MKSERNILIAFLLNLSFSVLEFFGGLFTGSIAILSDSVHDLGDAASIGISWFLERKSRREADDVFTYGYLRFSVLGGLITTGILAVGSVLVIISAVKRLIVPSEINYDGMLLLAAFGTVLNLLAAFVTRKGDSINQRSVNLHMLEDVLGWIVVLIGAVIMKFTDIRRIDPLMSIGVAVFILVHTFENLKEIGGIFLEKAPDGVDVSELKAQLETIDGVAGIHHIHVWSMDGNSHFATMHVVTAGDQDAAQVKTAIRQALAEHRIVHSVLETESESCGDTDCRLTAPDADHHHHHHH